MLWSSHLPIGVALLSAGLAVWACRPADGYEVRISVVLPRGLAVSIPSSDAVVTFMKQRRLLMLGNDWFHQDHVSFAYRVAIEGQGATRMQSNQTDLDSRSLVGTVLGPWRVLRIEGERPDVQIDSVTLVLSRSKPGLR